MKKTGLLLALAVAVCALFSGCGQSAPERPAFDADCEASSPASQTVAENDAFALRWNDEAKCVALVDKTSGRVWSAVPEGYLAGGGESVNVRSPLNIRVVDVVSLQWETVNGCTAVLESGRIVCEKTDTGVTVTYYFDDYEISVPVQYTLTDSGLTVSIDPDGIRESGATYRLIACSVSPFLCSAVNDTANYLFVPSGSGALMYTAATVGDERRYSGELYGTDPARVILDDREDTEAVRLPVFGTKDGDAALLGIVDAGTGLTFIEAEAGNPVTGYSSVYPTFYFRSYDTVKRRTTASGMGGGEDVQRVSDELSSTPAAVHYYPLSGALADYNGMAKKAREVLTADKAFVSGTDTGAAYGVTVLGGIKTTSSVVGLPVQTVKTMTSFAEAQQMLTELTEKAGMAADVRLYGFGNGGVGAGGVAGGYRLLSQFGKNTSVEDWCAQNGVRLFTDFDLIRYDKSGSGFSFANSAAKTALRKRAEQYVLNVPLRDQNTDEPYRALGRKQLLKAFDKLLKKADGQHVSALSLSTLGSVSYSDYADPAYYAKGNMASDVQTMLAAARAAGYPTAVAGANAYAAGVADVLFDVPTDKCADKALDVRIPFYQLVYGGTKPLYGTAVNTAADMDLAAALAVSSGVGMGFTVAERYDVSFVETGESGLYAAVYADVLPRIQTLTARYREAYAAILGATPVSYGLPENGVCRTAFDNGMVLYTNLTAQEKDTSHGKLAAYGCYVAKEADSER